MLQPDLYDNSDAYIAVSGTITVKGDDNRNVKNRSLAFKIMFHLLIAYQRPTTY